MQHPCNSHEQIEGDEEAATGSLAQSGCARDQSVCTQSVDLQLFECGRGSE